MKYIVNRITKYITNLLGDAFWKPVAWFLNKNPWLVHRMLERSFKTPYFHLAEYMNRWWIFNAYDPATKRCKYKWLPSIRFHHILREDHDSHLHDHPWNARTIILRGWYVEEKENGFLYIRKSGYTGRINFGEFHNIKEVSKGGVLTMFITYKYCGTWGFKVDGRKIPYYEYLGDNK